MFKGELLLFLFALWSFCWVPCYRVVSTVLVASLQSPPSQRYTFLRNGTPEGASALSEWLLVVWF